MPARSGACALAALLVCLAPACARAPRRPPDVVLISIDTTRADVLTFEDERTAPNLTRLARRGTVFTRAVAGSSWTLPSHAQIFTGLPPALHGVESDDVTLDPLVPTLPELLSRAGWQTLGFYTGWYVSAEYGFGRGFDRFENAMTGGAQLERDFRRALAEGAAFVEANAAREVSSHRDVTSRNVVAAARAALDALDPERPLMLFAHFFDPHFDYIPPPPFDTRFDPDYRGPIDGRDYWHDRRIWDPTRDPPRRIGERDLEHVRALYRGEVAWTDDALGELLALLEERGRLRDAVVIVTSDHGEEFFEHGGRGHRRTLYEEVLRVPLLVVPPGGAREPRADLLVGLSDVAPTVLELVGLELPGTMDGRSLAPALRGAPLADRPQLASLYRWERTRSGRYRHWFTHTLRGEESSFTRTTVVEPDGELRLAGVELHDLRVDPGQRAPSPPVEHPRVAAAWRELERELARLRDRAASLPRSPDAERTTGLARFLERDLVALGYVDEPSAGGDAPLARHEHLPWGLAPMPAFPYEAARTAR